MVWIDPGQVKSKSMMLLLKVFKFSSPDVLRHLLIDVQISTFLVSLLKDINPAMVATGVRIAEVLMEKLPDVFQTFFAKVFFRWWPPLPALACPAAIAPVRD